MLDTAAPLSATPDASTPQRGAPASDERLAQGVVCGPWALAFRFNWARSIVEQYELVTVPRAPTWFAGAANIDGNIVPVIDLALYINPDSAGSGLVGGHGGAQRRLLVGGVRGGDADDAVGIMFSHLPQQLRYRPQALEDITGLPARLRELCSAYAVDAAGQIFLEIDGERLMDAIAQEL